MDSLAGLMVIGMIILVIIGVIFSAISYVFMLLLTYWYVIAGIIGLRYAIKYYPSHIKPQLIKMKQQAASRKAAVEVQNSGKLLAGWDDYITVNTVLPPLVNQQIAPHYHEILTYVKEGDINKEVYFIFDKNMMMLQDMARDCKKFKDMQTMSPITQSKITAMWQELQLINNNIMHEIHQHAEAVSEAYLAESRQEREIMDKIIAEKKQ